MQGDRQDVKNLLLCIDFLAPGAFPFCGFTHQMELVGYGTHMRIGRLPIYAA